MHNTENNHAVTFKPWQQILVALIAGVVVGLALGGNAIYLKPIGMLFIHAIQMMIVPVVFTAIICAVLSMDDLQKMRRLSLKAFCLYSVSMAVAAIIGLSVATLVGPGKGLHLVPDIVETTVNVPTFTEALINVIPANPIAAFASGNILQILVFALILGVSINLAGERARPIANMFRSFSAVTISLTHIVMKFAPYGIFSLIAWVSGEYGIGGLIPLLKLVLTIYCCCFLLSIFFYALTLQLYTKMPALKFFQSISDAILLAISTSSSAATLPVTMQCAEENLKISKKLSGFLLPLGTTMNLNGLSIYLSVATVFAANVYGIELHLIQYVTIVVTIILTSMGAGGVPGSGIIVMSAVMSSVGIPLGAVTLIAGVDRLNDMAQTTTNVIGDLYAAAMIAKSEDELHPQTDFIDASSPLTSRDL